MIWVKMSLPGVKTAERTKIPKITYFLFSLKLLRETIPNWTRIIIKIGNSKTIADENIKLKANPIYFSAVNNGCNCSPEKRVRIFIERGRKNIPNVVPRKNKIVPKIKRYNNNFFSSFFKAGEIKTITWYKIKGKEKKIPKKIEILTLTKNASIGVRYTNFLPRGFVKIERTSSL